LYLKEYINDAQSHELHGLQSCVRINCSLQIPADITSYVLPSCPVSTRTASDLTAHTVSEVAFLFL